VTNEVGELTVNEVAVQAELTTGAFYRYFRDLDELIAELAGTELATAIEAMGPVFAEPAESAASLWLALVDAMTVYLEGERVSRVLFQYRRLGREARIAAGQEVTQPRPWELLGEYLRDAGLLSGDLDDLARLRIELLWLQTEELLVRAFRKGAPADAQVRQLMRENLRVQAELL